MNQLQCRIHLKEIQGDQSATIQIQIIVSVDYKMIKLSFVFSLHGSIEQREIKKRNKKYDNSNMIRFS